MVSKIFNDPVAISTILLVIATLLLAFIAWRELHRLSKTSSGEFLHKFKNDFFNEDARILITLLRSKRLIFQEKNEKHEMHFRVDKTHFPKTFIECIGNRKIYSDLEIDDYLLVHFEDLGLFEKMGIIDIEMIYEQFKYYINLCYNNAEIQKYIQNIRTPDNWDTYDNFDYIYTKCKSYEESKRKKRLGGMR